ncbi:MAG TPA: hypothetical protein VG347_03485 [Verrucomicrobiae bacterium]|nr:hypothetical protein [Verrucomicrobiae bacterium]
MKALGNILFGIMLMLLLWSMVWMLALAADGQPLPPTAPLPVAKVTVLHASAIKPSAQLMAKSSTVAFAPPAWLTVTSCVPVMFMVSSTVTGPWYGLGSATNRIAISTSLQQAFIRSRLETFPTANFPITASWQTNALAARYRLYIGSASRAYSQIIEVPPTNCWTTSIWQCWATNYLAMTCFDANGNESQLSNELLYQPAVALKISR